MRRLIFILTLLLTACSDQEETWKAEDGSSIYLDDDQIKIKISTSDEFGNPTILEFYGEVIDVLRGEPASDNDYIYLVKDDNGFISLLPRHEINESNSYFFTNIYYYLSGQYQSLQEIKDDVLKQEDMSAAPSDSTLALYRMVFGRSLNLEEEYLFKKE